MQWLLRSRPEKESLADRIESVSLSEDGRSRFRDRYEELHRGRPIHQDVWQVFDLENVLSLVTKRVHSRLSHLRDCKKSVSYRSSSFLLLSLSAVAISDLDRLIGEGVTLCGHACFNTTCSLATVLKGGADCELASRHG